MKAVALQHKMSYIQLNCDHSHPTQYRYIAVGHTVGDLTCFHRQLSGIPSEKTQPIANESLYRRPRYQRGRVRGPKQQPSWNQPGKLPTNGQQPDIDLVSFKKKDHAALIPSEEIGQLPSSVTQLVRGKDAEGPVGAIIEGPHIRTRWEAGGSLMGNVSSNGLPASSINDEGKLPNTAAASGGPAVDISYHACDASNPAPNDHDAWIKHFQDLKHTLPHHHYFWYVRDAMSEGRALFALRDQSP